MKRLLCAFLFCLAVEAGQAQGDVVYSTFGPGNSYDTFSGVDIDGPDTLFPQGLAEQFIPATNAYLNGVEVAVSPQSGAAALSLRVFSDSAGSPGDLLDAVQIANFSNGIAVANFSGYVLLDSGSSYWLGAFTTNGNEQLWHDTTATGAALQAISDDDGATWSTFLSDPFPRASFRVNGTPVTSDGSLIVGGAAWRYFRGLAEPSAGLEWTTATFDDAAWDFDVEGFGYDSDPLTQAGLLSHVGKQLTDMRDDGINPNSYTALYLRRMFDVADPTVLGELVLELDYDDSFIAYINGVEVARSEFGTVGVAEPFDALGLDHESTNGDPNQPLERFVIDVLDGFPGLLQAGGDNVLAIQGLNVALDDDDFVLSQISLGGSLLAATIDGDYNLDNVVDAADYVVWRKTDGSRAGFDPWRANFGQTVGGSGSGAGVNAIVPEPTTLVMLIVVAVGIRLRRRHIAQRV